MSGPLDAHILQARALRQAGRALGCSGIPAVGHSLPLPLSSPKSGQVCPTSQPGLCVHHPAVATPSAPLTWTLALSNRCFPQVPLGYKPRCSLALSGASWAPTTSWDLSSLPYAYLGWIGPWLCLGNPPHLCLTGRVGLLAGCPTLVPLGTLTVTRQCCGCEGVVWPLRHLIWRDGGSIMARCGNDRCWGSSQTPRTGIMPTCCATLGNSFNLCQMPH